MGPYGQSLISCGFPAALFNILQGRGSVVAATAVGASL